MSEVYDGSQLNAPLVVFLVIIGAGFSVTMGFAINRLFHLTDVQSDGSQLDNPSGSQRDYMRQVRLQNQTDALREAQGSKSTQIRSS